MSKSVLDLQNYCLNNTIPCSQLLLNAYAIARKLHITEMVEFCKKEMDGYQGELDNIPNYRAICIDLQLYNGQKWNSVVVPSNSYISWHSVWQSVKELEILCSKKQSHFQINLTTEQIDAMRAILPKATIFKGAKIVSAYQIEGIIFKIRRSILEWTLKLGEDGVWGENLEFTAEEQEKAKNAPSIQIIINGNVTSSNVAGVLNDSISSIQTQNEG